MPDAAGNFKGSGYRAKQAAGWERVFADKLRPRIGRGTHEEFLDACECPMPKPGRCHRGSTCEANCHAIMRE